MNSVKWSKALEVGVPLIDADHRHLFALVEAMEAAIRSGAERDKVWHVLSELEQYTGYHFAREEKLMVDHRYEFFKEHRAEHRQLLLEVEAKIVDFQAKRASAEQIGEFMRRWLLKHIAGSDTHLAGLIRRQRALDES